MPFLHRGRALCVAFLVSALVVSPALAAEENQQVTIEMGEISTSYSTGSFSVQIKPQYTIYFGCVPAGNYYYGPNGFSAGQAGVPAADANGLRKATWNISMTAGSTGTLQGSIAGPFTAEGKDFDLVINPKAGATMALNNSSNVVDTQQISIRLKGRIKQVAGSGGTITVTHPFTVSLKPGGLADGKTRIPQPGDGGDDEEEEEDEKVNVLTNYPKYVMGEDGNVYQSVPPTYNINGETGDWGHGANWNVVTIDGGSGTSGWAPPGSVMITTPEGDKYVMAAHGRDFTGYSGTVNRAGDGSLVVDVFGSGYGSNYSFNFPSDYVPKKIDGTSEDEPEPTPENVDLCFGPAMVDLGLGTPPVDPEDPDDDVPTGQPPDGTKNPDPIALPSLPGGGGSGGGTGGGGGTALPSPKPKPPEGGGGKKPPTDPGYISGGPLPDDNVDVAIANDFAQSTASSASAVQDAAGGLVGWANVSPTNFGTAGKWEVAMPLAGHTYTMEIPTEHAPLVRSVLLVLFTGLFISGCIRLLLS